MTGDEILVVDYEPNATGSAWPITTTAPPRVAILAAGPEELPAIAGHARLAMARSGTDATVTVGDESALDDLDAGTRLFVEAWRTRPRQKRKRRGEGAAWDAPGFEPPDPPPGWVDPSRPHGEE